MVFQNRQTFVETVVDCTFIYRFKNWWFFKITRWFFFQPKFQKHYIVTLFVLSLTIELRRLLLPIHSTLIRLFNDVACQVL